MRPTAAPGEQRAGAGAAMRRLVAAASARAVNGPPRVRSLALGILGAVDERRWVSSADLRFTLRTSSWTEAFRADTFWTKEPDTLEWLSATFGPESVLFDVGANVGVYTIYALLTGGATSQAVCFEPSALNFGRLCLNLSDNGLDGRALALPLALGDRPGITEFGLSSLSAGAALHGASYVTMEDAALRQGMVVARLDDLVAEGGLPTPTHLKIDVDGPELQVLAGAARTLASPSLSHVLIEVTLEEAPQTDRAMEEAGLALESVGPLDAGIQNRVYRRR